MSCLLILSTLKHNAYCVYQILSLAIGLHLSVSCVCGNVCDSQNKHNLFSNIISIYSNFLYYHENSNNFAMFRKQTASFFRWNH